MADRPRGRARGGQGGAEPRRRIRLREIQVLDQLVIGRSQHQIAASLGISQPAVSKIARRIEERLLSDLAYKVERQRARQTLQLHYLYAESMDAWHTSKQDAVRRRQRKTDDGGDAATVAEVVAENQHGDPRYLEVARKSLADLRSVWGIDAPDRVEAVTPFAAMSDAALAAELALQDRLLRPADADAGTRPPTHSAAPDIINVTQIAKEESDGHE
jgi:hypothetical protein